MAEEIPVYLFTGFMDSGKTSLIKDTIFENDFANGSKGLIIMCEDGDVEYDMDKLKAANIQVAEIDSEDEFTAAKLNELNMQYLPEQVFIEYNGTWGIDKIIEAELPKGWVIVQSLATVDSTTFDLYMNNMRAMMQEPTWGGQDRLSRTAAIQLLLYKFFVDSNSGGKSVNYSTNSFAMRLTETCESKDIAK